MRWYHPGDVVEIILSESIRWWSVCMLTFFLACGAEAYWLQNLLLIGIWGIPIGLAVGTILLLISAIYLNNRYRTDWQPVVLVLNGEDRQSLTDIRVNDLYHIHEEWHS